MGIGETPYPDWGVLVDSECPYHDDEQWSWSRWVVARTLEPMTADFQKSLEIPVQLLLHSGRGRLPAWLVILEGILPKFDSLSFHALTLN
jgi:hypothetical protein